MSQIIRRAAVAILLSFVPSSILWADPEPAAEPSGNSLSATAPMLPEVVVSANRLDTPASQVANSMTVITAKDIEQKQANTALKALEGVPGLTLLQNGGPGENVGLFTRGSDSGHTLVLLDGVPLNNPMSTSRQFDALDQFFVDDIRQIEVVRGPLSTIYGSNATAGVVNIISQPGEGAPKGSLLFEGGTFHSFREAASASAGNEWGNVALSVSRFDTQGFPSADKSFGNRFNSTDGNSTASLRLGLIPASNLDGGFSVRYNQSLTNVPAGGGLSGDDPNFFLDERQWVAGAQAKWTLFNGKWEQRFGISYTNDLQKFNDDITDPVAYPYSHYERGVFEGQTVQFLWQNGINFGKDVTLVLGTQVQDEWGRADDSVDYGYGPSVTQMDKSLFSSGSFAEVQTRFWDRLYITLGSRRDSVVDFGEQYSYRAAGAYFIPGLETKLKATVGTGFKAPSVYQLYSPYGNTALSAETSQGWDLGVEQPLAQDTVRVGATYFRNDFSGLIDFESILTPPYGQYFNVSRAQTLGWETFLSADPLKGLKLRADYTYTWAVDLDTGLQLIRRPQDRADFSASYQRDAWEAGFNLVHVGDRPDAYFDNLTYSTVPVTLPAYTLVNLMGSFQVDEHLKFFGRINNLFDAQYEAVYGYGTPGISFYAGTKVSL